MERDGAMERAGPPQQGVTMAIIPSDPNPGPSPVPDLPPIDVPPIQEPEPDLLPDEEPNPNPDENDNPDKQAVF